jgi:hypothetical protein
MKTPDWTYAASMYLPKKHALIYRDDSLGIQLQIMTKTRGFFQGVPKEYYFIDGDRRTFPNEEKMVRALLKRRMWKAGYSSLLDRYIRRIASTLNIL